MRGRIGLNDRIRNINFKESKWIWFHCSSLGEFNDGRILIDAIKKELPGNKILLTFFSPSGYEAIRHYSGADEILYMPLDTRQNTVFFLNTVKPHAIFFVRNDIWPHYVTEAKKRNIPLFLVSFQLSVRSKFLRFPQKYFYKKIFKKYNAVFVQDIISYEFLLKNKISNNLKLAGNLRIDTVCKTSSEDIKLELIEKFINGKFCVIGGSVLQKDSQIMEKVILNWKNDSVKWIIVPHEINDKKIKNLKKVFKDEMILFSEIGDLKGHEKILYVNSVGILSTLYRYAQIAFIGGGFTKVGIHSIIEPAVFGCIICFGPVYRNLPEATDMLNFQGAFIVNNKVELENLILKMINSEERKIMAEKNRNYIVCRQGATAKVVRHVLPFLE